MPESTLSQRATARIELLKLNLERSRYRAEIVKWVAIAIGSVVSFAVIDYGRLKLEEARAATERQLHLIEAYSKATEATNPDIWKRKLHVLKLLASDDATRTWVDQEFKYIDQFAALDALYRESLKVASQLVDPTTRNDPDREKARLRFEQLYWADLPFAGESTEVSLAMIHFREGLLAADATGAGPKDWTHLDQLLINLSETFKEEVQKLHNKYAPNLQPKSSAMAR